MNIFLYREGDGNEGNYPRFYVTLQKGENPWNAIRAIMANRYIAGSLTRRHVMSESSADGETQYGITAQVYEGPKGETAFGAAWITAEFEPATDADIERSRNLEHYQTLRETLDRPAWRFYQRLCNRGA